jgi:hypothetical protein
MNNRLRELGTVFNYALSLLGILMIGIYVTCMLIDRVSVKVVLFEQLFIYVGVSALGIIVCFTDVIFQKVGQRLRIIIFGMIVYVLSLIAFSKTMINPISNLGMLLYYTFLYASLLVFICYSWMRYEKMIQKNYEEKLKKFKR